MTRFRKDRVAELIRQVIADVIVRKIKDPRILGVTITEVRMTADLKTAKVYFSGLADGKDAMHLEGLVACEGFMRRQLREELALKYIPQLAFFYDSSFDNFARINKILKEIDTSGAREDS